jgi:hypothetical protein
MTTRAKREPFPARCMACVDYGDGELYLCDGEPGHGGFHEHVLSSGPLEATALIWRNEVQS